MKHLYLAASAAMVLTLAACGDNNEAQLTELQGQLETAQTENETLRGQVSELEAAQQSAAGQLDPATLREPLTTAFTALGKTEQQLDRFSAALTQEGYQGVSLDPLRENLLEASQAVAGAARDVGVDVDAVLAEAQSAIEEETSATQPAMAPSGGASDASGTSGADTGAAGGTASEATGDDTQATQPAQ